MSNCCASSASVFSPLTAAKATFALKAGVWFRRGRLLIVSPALQPSWPRSGRDSTYPTCSKTPSQLSLPLHKCPFLSSSLDAGATARHSASLLSDPGQPECANILQSLEVLRPTRDYVPDAYLHRLRGKRRDRHLPGRRGHDLLGWQHALADQPMN